MARASRSGPFTFDDFCFLVKEGQKADLIDGVIYPASPEAPDTNERSGFLFCLIADYVEEKDLGQVYAWRVAFRIDDTNAPEPDLGFVQRDRLTDIGHEFVRGRPDLAVEVVTPDSVERDYQKKREQYERAGVREYWIVDESEQKVRLLRLDTGKFRTVRPRKGILTSKVLPGFWLRTAWLWQKPLPKLMDALREIFSGTSGGGRSAWPQQVVRT